MKNSRKSIKKIIFQEKSNLDFSFIEREKELSTPHGGSMRIKTLSISALIILLISMVFLVVYIAMPKEKINDPIDEIFFFNQSDLEKCEIEITELPTDISYIILPLTGKFVNYSKEKEAIIINQYLEVEDDYNLDEINLVIYNKKYVINDFANIQYDKSMEFKGVSIEYFTKEEDFFLCNTLKFQLKEYEYILYTKTLDMERMFFYLEQLII